MSDNRENPDFSKGAGQPQTASQLSSLTPGIPDEDFIRDKVPMTKEEVRVISISKLRLTESSVVYDIGSGTGSVAVEIARLSPSIEVYAVEIKEEAVSLIKRNGEKFCCQNLHVVNVLAPDGLEKLPPPTHAFIGGSKGRLQEIMTFLKEKNPRVRIVLTAVSLETVAEMQSLLEKFNVTDAELVQVSVSRTEKLGGYHLFKANNPVFIYSFTFPGEMR
ncbi:MAG: precorrin-6Y C5,15-methyltransferase (decarboxylating) subunit CbiT [Treponemataceae bacterium]|nr:precorrin-6Y C5,15-methyltransferase (decarboxylating) subunit CbiT [Treponemataceae bacterium]